MIDWIKKRMYKYRAKQVSNYYNEWSHKFLNITDTFQGFRTENIDETHAYTVQLAGLQNSTNILDAGCGVGGPSFYFAKHLKSQIYSLTNSEVQIQIINERKAKEGLDNVHPTLGDYHHITDLFKPAFFDTVLFLESLGHSYYPQKAVSNAFAALKPGGTIYIRDHYIITGNNEEEERRIQELTKESNRTYVYNTGNLKDMVGYLEKAGFTVQFTQKPALQFFNINPEYERLYNVKSPNGYFIDTIEIKAVKPL